jgi:hypothetical protein
VSNARYILLLIVIQINSDKRLGEIANSTISPYRYSLFADNMIKSGRFVVDTLQFHLNLFSREQDHYKLEPNTCRTTRDFSLQFKQIQEDSSESRYQ